MSFSENVKLLRTNLGLTQGELAEKSGLTLGQISKIERGLGNPRLDTIEKIIEGLKCNPSDLLGHRINDRSPYLAEILANIDSLNIQDQKAIINVIRAMVTADSMRSLVADKSRMDDLLNYESYLNHLEAQEERSAM